MQISLVAQVSLIALITNIIGSTGNTGIAGSNGITSITGYAGITGSTDIPCSIGITGSWYHWCAQVQRYTRLHEYNYARQKNLLKVGMALVLIVTFHPEA